MTAADALIPECFTPVISNGDILEIRLHRNGEPIALTLGLMESLDPEMQELVLSCIHLQLTRIDNYFRTNYAPTTRPNNSRELT